MSEREPSPAFGGRWSTVELQIDELALHGFDPAQSAAIRAAVEQALVRLLAERGLPQALAGGGAATQIDGGSFVVEPGGPGAIGAQVAQAIYRGLGQGPIEG